MMSTRSLSEETIRDCHSRQRVHHQLQSSVAGQHSEPLDVRVFGVEAPVASAGYFVRDNHHNGYGQLTSSSYRPESNIINDADHNNIILRQRRRIDVPFHYLEQTNEQQANRQLGDGIFFDINNRDTQMVNSDAIRSNDIKSSLLHQHPTFNFEEHQMSFGSNNLTSLTPMSVGPSSRRSMFCVDERTDTERLDRWRMQRIPTTTCDDFKTSTATLQNFTNCGLSSFNLSPPQGRIFDQSDDSNADVPSSNRSTSAPLSTSSKRCDRKPIPDSQKDDRYYERREKNNAAAKKSRDARKQRIETARRERDRLRMEGEFLEAQLVAWRSACDKMKKMLRQAEETDRMRHMTELFRDGAERLGGVRTMKDQVA